MKTARERAQDWLKKAPHDEMSFLDNLELLLKEQDKITRHACAEAVITEDISGPIDKRYAHSIIMNTRAV